MHEDLSSEELHRLVRAYARCWLAHDGCWFLAVEEERGLEEAIRQDERAWARFAPLEARRRRGLPDFPCKPVGKTEFSQFAKAVDPRIVTRCAVCPPDELPDGEFYAWEFRIE